MGRFTAIGAAVERAAHEGAMEEIKNFKLQIHKSKLQLIGEIISAFLPKTRSRKNALREKNEKILATIHQHRPLIEEQYKLYHRYFYMWENNNNESGYHRQAEASHREDRALDEIERLTNKLQSQLDEIGWKYLPILSKNDLVTGYPGRIYIDNVQKYFAALEKHFTDEVRSLS